MEGGCQVQGQERISSQFLQIPAIIYLERSNIESTLDFSQLPDQLDPSILYQDTSISLYVIAIYDIHSPNGRLDTVTILLSSMIL